MSLIPSLENTRVACETQNKAVLWAVLETLSQKNNWPGGISPQLASWKSDERCAMVLPNSGWPPQKYAGQKIFRNSKTYGRSPVITLHTLQGKAMYVHHFLRSISVCRKVVGHVFFLTLCGGVLDDFAVVWPSYQRCKARGTDARIHQAGSAGGHQTLGNHWIFTL